MKRAEFRHPVADDIGAITELFNLSRAGLPFERESTEEEVRAQTFKDPDYEADCAVVAEIEDRVVGYSDAIIDKARLSAGRREANARIEVLPGFRVMGLDSELLLRSLEFLRSRGMDAAQAWCFEGDEWRRGLYESEGFARVHNYYSMIRTSGTRPAPVPEIEGFTVDHRMLSDASHAEMSEALGVVNEAFSELFNYYPWTVERFANMRDVAEEVMRLTYVRLGGELVGASLCEDSVPYNKQHGLRDGWINIIAVRKPFRRRGIGRLLMLDGMHWLLDRDLPVIHLGVDAENRRALGLYTSLGFEVLHENTIYSRPLKS